MLVFRPQNGLGLVNIILFSDCAEDRVSPELDPSGSDLARAIDDTKVD